MAIQKKVNVVTIGAGWTAAILAWKLGEAGYDVVSIEQGPSRWTDPDFLHNHDPLRYHARHAMMVNLKDETWTWRPNPRLPSLPMRQYGSFNPGQGLGGAAIHWTAQLWRFLPSDFRYRTHHIERYGANKLPEGNRIQDWPLTYDELESYYDDFEYDIGASGKAGNLQGTQIAGGNIFEGPRRREYPLPPMPVTVPSEMFANAATELGYHPFPHPAGITSQAYRDRFGNYRAGCLLCGFCTRYGCEVDAKASPQTTHLPAALKTGHYHVRVNSKVLHINTGADGLATGVTYVDENGVEQEQPADVVIASGFTLTNVRMLLLSRSDRHPNGIGNDRGMVGKNYTYQLFSSPFNGYFPGRKFNLFMGNGVTMNVIFDFNADNFDHSDLDFIGGAQIYATSGERDPVTSADAVPVDGTQKWGQEWKTALREEWNSYADLGIEGESLPYEDQFLDLDPNYVGGDGQPLLRLTFDWHDNDKSIYKFLAGKCREILAAMGPEKLEAPDELKPYNIYAYQSTHPTGGAIMGADPGNSVANKYGQVWDTPNVFVTGAALFPQNPGANPTGTVAALAYLTGDVMRDRYWKNPNQLLG
jgi:gluconate 2-dehydrogenase alpha chain